MSRDYDEKRNFPRMQLNCEAQFADPQSGERFTSMVINLSGGGVLFKLEQDMAVGTRLVVRVNPGTSDRPPLTALIRIIRVQARDKGGYQAAAVIEQMLDDDAPDEFV